MYNKFNLENKVIIVTGATGLLGIKHVEAIAENGGIPIILDIKNSLVNFIFFRFKLLIIKYIVKILKKIIRNFDFIKNITAE